MLVQPGLKFGDPLPGTGKLRPRLGQRACPRRSDATSAASTPYGGGSPSPGIPGPYAPPLPVSPDVRHHFAAHVLELIGPYRKETR
jgi:hypothetical protein